MNSIMIMDRQMPVFFTRKEKILMTRQYKLVNMRAPLKKLASEIKRSSRLCYQINTMDPTSAKIQNLIKELFHGC